jgi:hypothetical protein
MAGRDWLVLLGLLGIAALLRLVDLPARGSWDGDQGHDMLVMRAWVQDGLVPLLGPPTSIGDVHHGAWYYYLLAPPAFLTGGDDPTAVVGWIALAGVAAVGVVWWFARDVAGPIAGTAAGLLLAVSAAAVEGSTFIWNPNLIALSSAVALAAAWRAWSGGAAWWWVVAVVGVAVTMQCHVLGAALLPVILVPLVLDARRRAMRGVLVAGLAVFLVAYLPLIIHELTTDFAETDAFLAYLGGARDSGGAALPIRSLVVGVRVVSWPLVGLIADAFVPAVLVTAGVMALVAWLARDRGGDAAVRRAARWLGAGLAWTVLALAVAAPSLAVVVRGLPNDHYHAFADPMVHVLVGAGLAAFVVRAGRVGALTAVVVVMALAGWNLTHLPPPIHLDGGWPAGRAAGDRVVGSLRDVGISDDAVVLIESLPAFKSTEAVAYPLVRHGQAVHALTPDGTAPGSRPLPATTGALPAARVLLCDDLFRVQNGAACGGRAEDGHPAASGTELVERFEAHPGRWISVYVPTTAEP